MSCPFLLPGAFGALLFLGCCISYSHVVAGFGPSLFLGHLAFHVLHVVGARLGLEGHWF